ncbi:MAG: arabinose-5-phosphate isomerase [Phycisphaerales bacterium]|jgi:arabinose-5-phosphate isomerase
MDPAVKNKSAGASAIPAGGGSPAEGESAAGGGSGAREFAARVLQAEADAVASVIGRLDAGFDRAVEIVRACTGSVVVSGIGKSGLIGAKLSATMSSVGIPSHFMHSTEAAHGDLGRIRRGDIAILLSYGGGTEEVIALAALLAQDKVPLIGMSRGNDTHLAGLVDAHLSVGTLTEVCPNNLAPSSSTTAMMALGDALALAVSDTKEFSAEDFRKRHPGGLLGKRMLPLTSVMRFTAEQGLSLVPDTGTLASALKRAESEGRRAGAIVLVDSAGKLSGILTDADVRRRIVREGPGVLDKPVSELMTKTPRCLTDKDLVRDAVQLVREVRLDEIPVVDDHGKPVGLIDVQDLIALKLIEDPT